MGFPRFLKVALPAPLARTFDYLPRADQNHHYVPGIRLKVPFGPREAIGILVDISSTSDVAPDKLKMIIEVLDDAPILDPTMLKLLLWSSDYYHHPIGEVLFSAIPGALRKGKPIKPIKYRSQIDKENELPHTLNAEQRASVDQVLNHLGQFGVFLLEGVTGSGKTEVYLHIIEKVLAENKQALILVPEISLTPQTLSRFENRFNVPVLNYHSGMTDKQRFETWQLAREGKAKIVIGTRSAVFLPLANPGVIIIDEVHDSSFKQQEGFRYSARDLVVKRASLENTPVVLGTATPSLEIIHNVKNNKFTHLNLTQRAGKAALPKISIIDVRGENLQAGLSKALLTKLKQHLADQGQVMIFLNRRGFAPTLICHQCGWIATCRYCDSKMTVHIGGHVLHCHHCSAVQKEICFCPSCKAKTLTPLGVGTERIEHTLNEFFPEIKMSRVDRDSTRKKGTLEEILALAHSGDSQILIGTQMLAKGHHFPNMTMVAILDIDGGLFSADFRSVERMAQLLVQVAGRAGRAEKIGEVVLQTRNPEHPVLTTLLQEGYPKFSNMIYNERKLANLPPFSHMALLKAESKKQTLSIKLLEDIRELMARKKFSDVQILGPIPSPMEKKAGWYRAQLLFQSTQRKNLHAFLSSLYIELENNKLAKKMRWNLDVDPQEMF